MLKGPLSVGLEEEFCKERGGLKKKKAKTENTNNSL